MADASPIRTWQTLAEAGLSAGQVDTFLNEWQKDMLRVQFHSLIMLRHGKCVFRMNVAPYDDTTPHTLYSLSKSFTSAAAGFAVSEGLLRWDTPVTEMLPEEIPQGREEELKQVTLESLLCMGSGLDEASDSPSPDPAVTWARHVLSHPVKYKPMSHFHYNTFGTYLVSCMVQKAAGMNIRDYLMPRLFDKLGIREPHWEQSPQGVCCGGFGLSLSTEDIARFGQCLLEHGRWQGEQVLPEGWVELASREHIANYGEHPEAGNEWAQGYGFQFWRCIGGRYRGDGAMGQLCLVDEEHDAVIAATCGTNDMGEEYRLIREYLIPALDGVQEGDSAASDAALKAKLASLAYALPADDGTSFILPQGWYSAEHDGGKLSVCLDCAAYGLLRLQIRFDEYEPAIFHLTRGLPSLAGTTAEQGRVQWYFGSYGCENGRLHACVRSTGGPQMFDGFIRTEGDRLVIEGTGVCFPNGRLELTKQA